MSDEYIIFQVILPILIGLATGKIFFGLLGAYVKRRQKGNKETKTIFRA